MAGMRSPAYFGSLYDYNQDSPFQRQMLSAREGLTGQRGQISSFQGAQAAQQQQMASLRDMAMQQAAQQAAQLQQAAQSSQTSAERARQSAISEQNSNLQAAQFRAEMQSRNAALQEQLQLQRDQEARRQYLETPQPVYADYGRVNNSSYISPYETAIRYGASPEQAARQAQQSYADQVRRGGPGNVYIVGYQRPAN